jgi:hypothetical protein
MALTIAIPTMTGTTDIGITAIIIRITNQGESARLRVSRQIFHMTVPR